MRRCAPPGDGSKPKRKELSKLRNSGTTLNKCAPRENVSWPNSANHLFAGKNVKAACERGMGLHSEMKIRGDQLEGTTHRAWLAGIRGYLTVALQCPVAAPRAMFADCELIITKRNAALLREEMKGKFCRTGGCSENLEIPCGE